MEDGELSQVGNTKETIYLDNTYEKERHYVYKICTRNIDGLLTSSIAIPVFAADLIPGSIPVMTEDGEYNYDFTALNGFNPVGLATMDINQKRSKIVVSLQTETGQVNKKTKAGIY